VIMPSFDSLTVEQAENILLYIEYPIKY